jgi:hypothetical protein
MSISDVLLVVMYSPICDTSAARWMRASACSPTTCCHPFVIVSNDL